MRILTGGIPSGRHPPATSHFPSVTLLTPVLQWIDFTCLQRDPLMGTQVYPKGRNLLIKLHPSAS